MAIRSFTFACLLLAVTVPPSGATHYCSDTDPGGYPGGAVVYCEWACEGGRLAFVNIGSDDPGADVTGQANCSNGPATAFCSNATPECSDYSNTATTPNTVGLGQCTGSSSEFWASFLWIYCDAYTTGAAGISGTSARIEVRHGLPAGVICEYRTGSAVCGLAQVTCVPIIPTGIRCEI